VQSGNKSIDGNGALLHFQHVQYALWRFPHAQRFSLPISVPLSQETHFGKSIYFLVVLLAFIDRARLAGPPSRAPPCLLRLVASLGGVASGTCPGDLSVEAAATDIAFI
jgi:hypothetical protein